MIINHSKRREKSAGNIPHFKSQPFALGTKLHILLTYCVLQVCWDFICDPSGIIIFFLTFLESFYSLPDGTNLWFFLAFGVTVSCWAQWGSILYRYHSDLNAWFLSLLTWSLGQALTILLNVFKIAAFMNSSKQGKYE